nr:uncharacterized protein LOC129437078 [Misgurnus anguillicaudatus]
MRKCLLTVYISSISTTMAGRRQTWSCEEVRNLIEIWSDEHIRSQLSKTHKNSAVFSFFSKQLRDRGFHCSVEQCQVKAKKLRQQYIQVRDALKKTGSSVTRKTSSPGTMIWTKYLGQNRTLIQWMLLSPMNIQLRPLPMMLTQVTGLPHLTQILTWEIQAMYHPILISQSLLLLMKECLMIQAQRAMSMKKASEEGDCPFLEPKLEKERKSLVKLMMKSSHI